MNTKSKIVIATILVAALASPASAIGGHVHPSPTAVPAGARAEMMGSMHRDAEMRAMHNRMHGSGMDVGTPARVPDFQLDGRGL